MIFLDQLFLLFLFFGAGIWVASKFLGLKNVWSMVVLALILAVFVPGINAVFTDFTAMAAFALMVFLSASYLMGLTYTGSLLFLLIAGFIWLLFFNFF